LRISGPILHELYFAVERHDEVFVCGITYPEESLQRWSDLAGGFDFPVIGLPVADLHKRIPEVVNGREAVVIDVPQMEDHARIARGAMRYARGWIVPVAPSGVEVDRMARVAREMEDMQSLRSDPADAVVMLNRTNRAAATRTGPDADVRQVLTARGYRVLATQVPHNDGLYRQTFGTSVVAAGTAQAAQRGPLAGQVLLEPAPHLGAERRSGRQRSVRLAFRPAETPPRDGERRSS